MSQRAVFSAQPFLCSTNRSRNDYDSDSHTPYQRWHSCLSNSSASALAPHCYSQIAGTGSTSLSLHPLLTPPLPRPASEPQPRRAAAHRLEYTQNHFRHVYGYPESLHFGFVPPASADYGAAGDCRDNVPLPSETYAEVVRNADFVRSGPDVLLSVASSGTSDVSISVASSSTLEADSVETVSEADTYSTDAYSHGAAVDDGFAALGVVEELDDEANCVGIRRPKSRRLRRVRHSSTTLGDFVMGSSLRQEGSQLLQLQLQPPLQQHNRHRSRTAASVVCSHNRLVALHVPRSAHCLPSGSSSLHSSSNPFIIDPTISHSNSAHFPTPMISTSSGFDAVLFSMRFRPVSLNPLLTRRPLQTPCKSANCSDSATCPLTISHLFHQVLMSAFQLNNF